MTDRILSFCISADYARETGGWIYAQRVLDGLADLGWTIDRVTLPAGFPQPGDDAVAEARKVLEALPDGRTVLIDQICLSAMPDVAAVAGRRLKLMILVHHPVASEYGERLEHGAPWFDRERETLRHVACAVVTSDATAEVLRRCYGVPESRIVMAPPGTDPVPLSPAHDSGDWNVLCVGAVIPRKGQDRLIHALAGLDAGNWRLTIAGDDRRDPQFARRVRTDIQRAGLESRVRLTGRLDQTALAGEWRQAHLYVSGSRHEGYGMAVADAIARGVPVVTTPAGAVATWLDPDAGIVAGADTHSALSDSIRDILADRNTYSRLREGAIRARQKLPVWRDTASKHDAALKDLQHR